LNPGLLCLKQFSYSPSAIRILRHEWIELGQFLPHVLMNFPEEWVTALLKGDMDVFPSSNIQATEKKNHIFKAMSHDFLVKGARGVQCSIFMIQVSNLA
jgi:hypothetical protein